VLFTLSLTSWGIVLACLRLRHESLWTPVLMHAVANAFTLGAYDLIADPHSNWLTSPWGLTGMVLTLPVALWLLSRLKPGSRQAPNRHSS
jgi:membrane protease YdiL (CAAX protease family)